MEKVRKIHSIAWVTSTLDVASGGARLLLEGIAYYKSIGIRVLVITWDFHEDALFDGRYSKDDIFEIRGSKAAGLSLTSRALKRLMTIKTLRNKLVEFKPDIIFNQSEYDATILKIALVGTKLRYASFIFGQMFQFYNDITKYAFPFNRHLEEIRNSTPGYREFVSEKRPVARLRDIFLVQLIAIPRYFAIRSSVALFVFSKQVQWEVSKLYGVSAHIQKGAYPRSIIGQKFGYDISKLDVHPKERVLLSLSRLIEKKRVALKIRALDVLINERGFDNIRLFVGGKGDELDKLVKLVAELKLEKYVSFIGFVPEQELYPLTSACDVYLSMDVADFDISPYEALAMKRKVVWSSEMDQDEYLSKCGAIFATEPNPNDVATAIEKAIMKDERSIDWSRLDGYSWETYFQNILEIVEAKL